MVEYALREETEAEKNIYAQAEEETTSESP